MRRSWQIPRRTLLRGLGAALALPWLEAMTPAALAGAEPEAAAAEPALPLPRFKPPRHPVRFALFYLPMGTLYDEWKPQDEVMLRPLLAPLQPFAKDLNLITGMWNRNAAKDWQPHMPDESSFLLGTEIRKTTGADVNAGGISIDQLIGRCAGAVTRFQTLTLDGQAPRSGTSAGYSGVYMNTQSWSSPTTPVPCERDPRQVFNRLFRGTGDLPAAPGASLALGDDDRLSVLDAVLDQAKTLRRGVGVADQRKMDEYLTSVRDVEKRLEQGLKDSAKDHRIDPAAKRAVGAMATVVEKHTPGDIPAHVRLLIDLMVLALWTDSTRVTTLTPGGWYNMSFIPGVKGGLHEMSHHRGDQARKDQYRLMSTWYFQQYAYLLGRLRDIEEGDGTLLDRSLVLCGSGISDGNSHAKTNLPILLAGKGGGVVKTGRHLAMPQKYPLCNLYVTIQQCVGVQSTSFSDSTGALTDLLRA